MPGGVGSVGGIGGPRTSSALIWSVQMNTSQATAAMTNLKAAWAGVTAVTEKAMTGLMLAAGGIIAVGAAFYAATAMISGYEVALVRAGAIGGLTASQTGLLGNKIQQSAIKYGVAINDISDGIIELTKAGMNYEQTMGMVDTITKVAMANNIDYASAADIAVIATKAFKIPLTDLSGHMDKLQYVVQKTLMDMSDFNDILQYTGSTAVTFKVVPEELYAMAGALADVAQQAGQGSRHVNRLMVEMLKEVDQVQAWTDSLGMSVQVIKDGRLNITELIAAFSKLGMSQDVMLQSLNQFSILSSQAWLALLNNSKEYFDLLQGQAGATGTLETVVAPQLQTLQVQLKSLKAAFQAAFLTHDFITETHKAFDVLNKSVLNLIPNIQQLVFGLLQQAPAMFTSLFHIIQSVLPLLSNVLLPVMKTFSDILFTLTGGNNGTLVRLVLIFYMLRKYANPLGAAMDLYNFHFKELSLTTAVLQRNMLGIVSALILVIALRDKVKWAMYAVAASILAVAIAVVALRSVFGDWMAALKFGVTLASAIASSIAMIAMLQASTPSKLSNAAIDSSNASIAPLKMHSGSRYVAETGTYILKKGEAVLPDTTSTFGNNQFTLINRGTIYGSEDALRKLVRKIMREETGRVYA